MKIEHLQLALFLLLFAWLLGGCGRIATIAHPPPSQHATLPPSPESVRPTPVVVKPFTHKVRRQGETLTRIAWWYTGSATNWSEIAKANPALDPQRIGIGDLIIIPEHLLKTREPMAATSRFPVKPKDSHLEKLPPVNAAAPQTVDLFGPVDSTEQNSPLEKSEKTLPLERLE